MVEVVEDIVIAGAGIAGLTTALGLHRCGIRSLVLESSAGLRATGSALTTWTNAWKALDAIGIGDSLRKQHALLDGLIASSVVSGQPGKQLSFYAPHGKQKDSEIRCVKRKLLLEALENELPSGAIRFSSKVVSIEESGYFKLVHLADGTVIKTKVLIGCDGVNSVVAKWLGLKKPTFSGRSSIRGYVDLKGSHGFGSKYFQFFGNGIRAGLIPCDEETVYWFFTWTLSSKDEDIEDDPAKMKQYVLSKLEIVPDIVRAAVEATELDSIYSAPLRYRQPWELLWGNISKGNVCVAGDALHPMTPDIGQGGCSALEDGVVLARCLAEALNYKVSRVKAEEDDMKEEHYKRIEMGLRKYSKERRWRSFVLVSTAYVVGSIQQSNNPLISFLRDKILGKFLAGVLLKRSDFDCGNLTRP